MDKMGTGHDGSELVSSMQYLIPTPPFDLEQSNSPTYGRGMFFTVTHGPQLNRWGTSSSSISKMQCQKIIL